MDPKAYQDMAAQEDAHWWFRGRRKICETLLRQVKLPRNADILEAGCGSGGNLAMLSTFGKVHAFEPYAPSRAVAQKRSIGEVADGSLPDNIPFGDKQFDAIAMCDVLEHVKDDAASLRALYARTKPGGVLLINVPAHMRLWSKHDVAHHHFRRYARHELISKLTAAGWQVEFINQANFWLSPLIALIWYIEKFRPQEAPMLGSQMLPRPINEVLYWVFSSERWLVPNIRLPFGVSLIVLARKSV